MNLYKEIIDKLEKFHSDAGDDVVAGDIQRRMYRNECEALEILMDDNPDVDCEIEIEDTGDVAIYLFFPDFSTKNSKVASRMFEYATSITVSTLADETIRLKMILPGI